jgi:hypothetical protein
VVVSTDAFRIEMLDRVAQCLARECDASEIT